VPPDFPTSPAEHNDVSMGDEPLSQADQDAVMDQDMPTATPLSFTNPAVVPPPITVPQGRQPPPDSSARKRPLPLPPATESYLGLLLHQQFAELSDKVVVPALKNAVDAMMPAMIEHIAGEIRGISSPCSHSPCTPRHHRAVEEEDTEAENEDDLTPSPRRKHTGKRGNKNHLHVRRLLPSANSRDSLISACPSQISTGETPVEIKELSPTAISSAAYRSSF
jgi:hypothetical protein